MEKEFHSANDQPQLSVPHPCKTRTALSSFLLNHHRLAGSQRWIPKTAEAAAEHLLSTSAAADLSLFT